MKVVPWWGETSGDKERVPLVPKSVSSCWEMVVHFWIMPGYGVNLPVYQAQGFPSSSAGDEKTPYKVELRGTHWCHRSVTRSGSPACPLWSFGVFMPTHCRSYQTGRRSWPSLSRGVSISATYWGTRGVCLELRPLH